MKNKKKCTTCNKISKRKWVTPKQAIYFERHATPKQKRRQQQIANRSFKKFLTSKRKPKTEKISVKKYSKKLPSKLSTKDPNVNSFKSSITKVVEDTEMGEAVEAVVENLLPS